MLETTGESRGATLADQISPMVSMSAMLGWCPLPALCHQLVLETMPMFV